MRNNCLTRRAFVLTGFSLSACTAIEPVAVKPDAMSTAFDGNYEILIGRLWNDTPSNRASEYFAKHRDGPESLAFLTATVVGGRFHLTSVSDSSKGPNYSDFNAYITADGTFQLSTTVGYLVSKVSPYKIKVSANIGGDLDQSRWVTLMPSRGFDADYRAIIKIRRVM